MTGFEPRTIGFGSDRSTNWATTRMPYNSKKVYVKRKKFSKRCSDRVNGRLKSQEIMQIASIGLLLNTSIEQEEKIKDLLPVKPLQPSRLLNYFKCDLNARHTGRERKKVKERSIRSLK